MVCYFVIPCQSRGFGFASSCDFRVRTVTAWPRVTNLREFDNNLILVDFAF